MTTSMDHWFDSATVAMLVGDTTLHTYYSRCACVIRVRGYESLPDVEGWVAMFRIDACWRKHRGWGGEFRSMPGIPDNGGRSLALTLTLRARAALIPRGVCWLLVAGCWRWWWWWMEGRTWGLPEDGACFLLKAACEAGWAAVIKAEAEAVAAWCRALIRAMPRFAAT